MYTSRSNYFLSCDLTNTYIIVFCYQDLRKKLLLGESLNQEDVLHVAYTHFLHSVFVSFQCASYENGHYDGNLCETLCQSKPSSTSCLNFDMEKEAVFSRMWMNESIIFKSIQASNDGKLSSISVNNSTVFLENNLIDGVKKVVKMKFNLAVNDVDVKIMSYSQHSQSDGNRYVEKRKLWSLLHDNEYLALILYDKYNVFPKLLGTCGSLYAVQRLNSISGYKHLVSLYDSHAEWAKRVKISIMILDFLLQLDEIFPEPMLICDVKMNNFGVTSDFKKVKYIDLDSIYPLSVANRITGDGSECKYHSDCDLSDCRSFCNLVTYKCQHDVVNNNLQIVCEKIFLGWMMSGRVMVSGLLMGSRTPAILVEILEKCANPFSENGTPRARATKEIRKRLYNFLVHFI